jgi:hypothetical protein
VTLLKFKVVGFYAANQQRFAFDVLAVDARTAEDVVRFGGVADPSGDPQVCAVLLGSGDGIRCVDAYAYYVDPDAPAPVD